MDERVGDTNGPLDQVNLRGHAEILFSDMGLEGDALFAARAAFSQYPEGTVKVAHACFGEHVHSPGRLFGWFLGRGEHERAQLNGHRRTGWRWKRHSHGTSGTYVRDPRGTDPLPQGYDLWTRSGW